MKPAILIICQMERTIQKPVKEQSLCVPLIEKNELHFGQGCHKYMSNFRMKKTNAIKTNHRVIQIVNKCLQHRGISMRKVKIKRKRRTIQHGITKTAFS